MLSNLIDFIIEVVLVLGIYIIAPREIILKLLNAESYLRFLIVFLFFIVYRLLCHAIFHKTIGMMLLRLKYLNGDMQPLSARQRLIAAFITQPLSIKYYKEK